MAAMTLNAAYFFNDYEDKQESVLVPRGLADVATIVRNAATEEISGLEIDLSWQITRTMVSAGQLRLSRRQVQRLLR